MGDKKVWKPKKTILDTSVECLDVSGRVGNNPLNRDGHEVRDLITKSDQIDAAVHKEEDILSIDQASERLGVSQQTLRNWEALGKLVPERTAGGHRRYTESQINALRKKQLAANEFILPDQTPRKLRELCEALLISFEPDEVINLSISTGVVDGKVRVTIDSEDGLKTFVKTFNIKD
jgi:excisionase family DNA binding protein